MHLRDQLALGVTPSKVPDWTAFLSMLIGLFYNKHFGRNWGIFWEQIFGRCGCYHIGLDLTNVEVLAAHHEGTIGHADGSGSQRAG
ncbi:ADM_collapsed_G0059810.mRNA.1.CDS.1 [Saccharomyces cerevisiae]|nr:ADM_collapsed_G0059810.mRNA.1.CDS.1 [Saccharomyces cerevisiae]